MPPELRRRVTAGTVRTIPAHNIRAGIAYLLMRMAIFDWLSVVAGGAQVRQVVVKHGDTLERIAKANGSTVAILRRLNPRAGILKIGETLDFQEGTTRRVITGWRAFTTNMVAQRYNGGGDINYARKLDFALSLLRGRKEIVCP